MNRYNFINIYSRIPLHDTINLMIQGKIPIKKNICVIDNKNNPIKKTYLKRAKQLVKKFHSMA